MGCCSSSSNPYERLPLNGSTNGDLDLDVRSGRRKPDKDFEITARFFLRSKPGLSLVTHLDGIGQRPQKHYFTVKSDTRGNPMLLMTLVERPKASVTRAPSPTTTTTNVFH
jgi:hypothetical protein